MATVNAFESRGRRERYATELLGMDVRDVPKSALAVVAIYLAMADVGSEVEAARERLWREWRLLHSQGIIEAPCPVK